MHGPPRNEVRLSKQRNAVESVDTVSRLNRRQDDTQPLQVQLALDHKSGIRTVLGEELSAHGAAPTGAIHPVEVVREVNCSIIGVVDESAGIGSHCPREFVNILLAKQLIEVYHRVP